MDLIPKCPVKDPCEAATFEEAFSKNARRLAFELHMAKDLVEAVKKDGEEPLAGVDPEFWRGCITANSDAYHVFKQEFEMFLAKVASRVESVSFEGGKEFQVGVKSTQSAWAKALKENDPSNIVYW